MLEDEAVSMLQRMLRVDTSNPPGNELELAHILYDFFVSNDVEAELDEFLPGRANLVARLPGNGKVDSILLCGHMDVVPAVTARWTADPFGAMHCDNRIYGRGASDMKSGLAAMAVALVNLKRAKIATVGEVLFAATAGEEVDCCGARRLVERGVLENVGAVVIAEPTREDVIVGHKGALWIEISTRGKSAHSSMPEEGVNAIECMYRILGRLLDGFRSKVTCDPLLGSSTLSVSVIDGGAKVNLIPDECRLQVDVRTVPAQNHDGLLKEIKRDLDQARGEVPGSYCELAVLQERLPMSTSTTNRLPKVAEDLRRNFYGSPSSRAAVPYYTDASILVESYPKLAIIVYGAGDDRLAHKADEWVDVDAFLRSIRFYEQLVARYAGREKR